MSRLRDVILAACLLAAAPVIADDVKEIVGDEKRSAGHYGFGKTASAEEIAGWDIDIRPDGMGLPPGSGTPEDGEMMYEEQCATCHGSFGEGVGRYPVLSGGEDTLTEDRPEKTVGSFWPYASTLWDYIHRAMPFQAPQSLTDDEVYAITAYVLYLNDLVDYDFELNAETLATVRMPNEDGFYLDNRPDVRAKRCMKNCKPEGIRITSEPTIVTYFDAAQTIAVEAPHPGQSVYQKACAVCHDAGVGGAPVTGNAAAWAPRLELGRAALLSSVISGKGAMPPRAGQMQMSDDDLGASVDYMLGLVD